MFHTIILAGICGKDAVQKYTPQGKAVTTFSVAVSDGFGDNKKTIWMNISAWEKLSDTTKDLVKGAKVLIEGRLQHENGNPRQWESNGKHGSSFEVTASTVRFLSAKGETAEDESPF